MKLQKILFILLLFTFTLYANLNDYGFYYYGKKVGTVENFSNLDKGYLKVKPDSFLTKLLIKNKKQLVLYSNGNKPIIENSFYLRDKSNFIDIVNSIKKKPSSFEKVIGEGKKLIVTYGDKCYWSYMKDNKIKSEGYIVFDKNRNIIELKDISNNMAIKKGC